MSLLENTAAGDLLAVFNVKDEDEGVAGEITVYSNGNFNVYICSIESRWSKQRGTCSLVVGSLIMNHLSLTNVGSNHPGSMLYLMWGSYGSYSAK